MLILSNCLSETTDEGCLKVANNLVKRIKYVCDGTKIISYDKESTVADLHLTLNKLLLSKQLFSIIHQSEDSLLYIPFPSKMITTALRIFILSLYSRRKINTLLVMTGEMGCFAKIFLKLSRSNIVALSKESSEFYKKIISDKRVTYLKTGVDTERFTPVSSQVTAELKTKYGLDPNKPVVLHVGHLKHSRNIDELMKLDEKYQILLVTSTQFKEEHDEVLKQELLSHYNIKIIDEYISNIQEMYQLSDVYFFPVRSNGGCIDVPLSCLEAASCNKPIVTTDYGEMKEFVGKNGFFFIDCFSAENLNSLVEKAMNFSVIDTRRCSLQYDWECSVNQLWSLLNQ